MRGFGDAGDFPLAVARARQIVYFEIKNIAMRGPTLALLFSFLLVLPPRTLAAPVVLHVAPGGDDAGPGTVARPLGSLAGARDAIRAMKRAGALAGPVEVVFRPGTYAITGPVEFTPEDSGTESAPITYRGADPPEWPGGPGAILSGGRRIAGWVREGGHLVATLPEAAAGEWHFNQLYVNGHRRPRARGPNAGRYFRPSRALPGSDARWGIVYAGEEFRRWPNLDDVSVVIFSSWYTSAHFIEALDEARREVRFTAKGPRAFDQYEPNPRYYIENVFEYLDEPGEWFLDRGAGKLHYIPLPGEAAGTLEAFAPAVRLPDLPPDQRIGHLLHFRGEPEKGGLIRHLTFRDLAFRHTDAVLRRDVSSSRQAEPGRNASIYARGLCESAFENCEIAQAGEHGIFLHDGSCSNAIRGCLIHDLGGGGILCGGNWRWGKGEETHAGLTPSDPMPPEVVGNVIENNLIRDGGHVFLGIHGVWLGHASGHRIARNEISDLPYSGISVGWDWGGKPSTAHHNIIEKNRIHRIGLGMLNDLAGIYTLGDSPGTVIRNNLIHDIAGYESPVSYIVSAGIYMDMSSGHISVTDNIVHGVVNCGFFFHENPAVACENNIFAHFTHRERGGKRREDACVWAMFDMRRGEVGSTFRKNIVYGDVTNLVHLRIQGEAKGDVPPIRIDENCYRGAPGAAPTFVVERGAKRETLALDAWRALGHDGGSVFGEPGFADAGAKNFTLGADAAARKVGFRPIDVAGVGLVGDAAWCALPAAFPPRRPDPPTDYVPAPKPKALALDEGYEEVRPDFVPEAAEGPIKVVATGGAGGSEQCLQFNDRPGLERAWWPCRVYSELEMREGKVDLSFDFLMPSKNPAAFLVEFRDWSDELRAGPKVLLLPAGELRAGAFAQPFPRDRWCHLAIRFALGEGAPKDYTLTLEAPGAQPVTKALPFANKAFSTLTWFGLLMPEETVGAVRIDNLRLTRKFP